MYTYAIRLASLGLDGSDLEPLTPAVVDLQLCWAFSDNQDGSDWRDDDEKLPGHENLTEKDIELFRHIQELALQVGGA